MSIITADMIQIRKNGVPFVYKKTFNKINNTFYNKYVNNHDDDEEINTSAINVWYHGLPYYKFVLYVEKVVLHPLTKLIILDSDRTEIKNLVEFFHSLYNHILEKVEYNETTLKIPDVYEASAKYTIDKYVEYIRYKNVSLYTHITSDVRDSHLIHYYAQYYTTLQALYDRKRESFTQFNGEGYNATKEKLLKKIFANHKLPTPTLQQYNDWLSSEQGLDIQDRWTLDRYELMTIYAHSIKDPKYNVDKYMEKYINASFDGDYVDDEDEEDEDEDSNNDIEDEDVANFNINI